MRTIIFILCSFILVFVFQTCNENEEDKVSFVDGPAVSDSIVNTGSACPPCCNAGMPTDCNLFPERSLYLADLQQEICITCECCLEVYAIYGNPPNLSGIEVQSTLIGSLVCIPAIGGQ